MQLNDRAAIISAYEANEAAARAIVPGRFLLPEDVAACIEMAAEECGVTVEAAKDALAAHWTMQGGG